MNDITTPQTSTVLKCPECDNPPRSKASHKVGKYKVMYSGKKISLTCITCGQKIVFKIKRWSTQRLAAWYGHHTVHNT